MSPPPVSTSSEQLDKSEVDVPADDEFETKAKGSSDLIPDESVMRTPPSHRLSPANQAMLLRTARRLSSLAERYPVISRSPALEGTGPIRSMPALSPLVPQLGRRSSKGTALHEIDPHGHTFSPLHGRTSTGSGADGEVVLGSRINRNCDAQATLQEMKHCTSSIATSPPSRYVEAGFSKENIATTPNNKSMISSMRSVRFDFYYCTFAVCEIIIMVQMWTGDSSISIRDSLRSALDVHTPPANSVARVRRASALCQPHGSAAAVVNASRRIPAMSASAMRRQSALPAVAARSSTAPSSSHLTNINFNLDSKGTARGTVLSTGRARNDSVNSIKEQPKFRSRNNAEELPSLRNRIGRSLSRGRRDDDARVSGTTSSSRPVSNNRKS